PDGFTKAAVLMDGLTRNHAFIDGNKRISISTAALFLQVNGYRLTATNPDLEQFAIYVTTTKPSIGEIADWFRAKTVRTKSR
ncbi:MAG: type II toxin-antitoxin system death-on-curing family toxin, partial [Pyrinomonadaceae bacterium]|nr:type II toxin-antitoxin system death-on-curing family toxin [Pyrinomonadaceae bacterium]